MGGGDLNLKKSWHPSTFKNIERVWKVEQKHETERKKIEQLQAEIKEERAREEMQRMAVESGVLKEKEDRVDWLYSGPGTTINREDYLLGKKIDKLVDPTLIEQEREEMALAGGPGALFAAADTANTSTDLAAKIREDPLFIMKKKEQEAKKHLMSNPVKMKQLQELLSQAGTKKKKSSKKSKKKRHPSDSEEEDEQGDRHHHHTHSSSSHYRKDTSSHRHRDGTSHRHRDNTSHNHRDGTSHRHRDDTSPHYHRNDTAHRHRDDTSSRRHRDDTSRDHRDSFEHRSRERSRSPVRRRPVQDHSSHGRRHWNSSSSHTKRMSQAELERKREEMMRSAQEHRREQQARVSRFEKESFREEQERSEKPEQFLQPLRMQSLTSSQSLEDRIHRNINSVQRTRAALSDNFMPKQ